MRHLPTLLLFALATAFIGACGSPKENEGDVTISGSSTVQPLVSKLAGSFISNNPRAQVELDAPGTGEGFLLFCDGLTDINNASRPIDPVEKRACAANGVDYVELEIARDAAVVAMSDREQLPECLSLAQLFELTGPTSSGSDTWEGVAADDQVPKGRFELVAPPLGSGTSEVFVDLVIAELAEGRAQPSELRRDAVTVASDQLVGDVLREDPGSIGILGYSVASSEAGLRVLEVADKGSCVSPDRNTIEDGSYPLIRSLYMYVNADRATENATLRAFVDDVVEGDVGEMASDTGSIPVPDPVASKNQELWSARG